MKPTTPNLLARMKLCNQSTLIRPLINWKNALACELVKYLTEKFCSYTHQPNAYNIKNSMQVTADLQSMDINEEVRICADLQSMDINEEVRICSFNIENVYAKIYHNMTENNPGVIKQTKSNNEHC
jgi:hypothetical protein